MTQGDQWTRIATLVREKSAGRLGVEWKVLDSQGAPLMEGRFSGDAVAKIEASDPQALVVRWLMPEQGTIRDGDGNLWALPLIGRLRPQEAPPEQGEATASQNGQENKKKFYEPFKAESVPHLDAMFCHPAWETDALGAFSRIAREAKGEGLKASSFWKLEARLNALWTSGGARLRMRATLVADGDRVNPLKRLEGSRTLVLPFDGGDGRLRLPHLSHFRTLCPFATPESKDIGLHLFLAAEARWNASEGTFSPPEDTAPLFSFEVGLVPYAAHSDGPRIMMGGKNLKQAEVVEGAEPAMVPGVLEGDRGTDIFQGGDLKAQRLFPHLGVNAWVGVLPYGGFTYEDGLVVSESFARRMTLGDTYRQRVVLPLGVDSGTEEGKEFIKKLHAWNFEDFRKECLQGATTSEERVFGSGEKKKYVFGELLPLPSRLKEEKKFPFPFHERYHHHEPGVLEDLRVRLVSRRPTGGGKKGSKSRRQGIALELSYRFRVHRPLRVGDKLTGRHGNKGVVTRILSEDLMPKAHLGERTVPLEVLISPSSIIGRKNVGQLAEMLHALGLWAHREKLLEGKSVPSERGLSSAELKELLGRLHTALHLDADGSAELSVPERGPDAKCHAFVGPQYVARLRHHAAAKLQARGTRGPINALLGQPTSGGPQAGQRLGEMENWALLSHGLAWGGKEAREFLLALRGKEGPPQETKEVLKRLLFALGLDLEWKKGSCRLSGARGEACSLKDAAGALELVANDLPAFEDGDQDARRREEARKLRVISLGEEIQRLADQLPHFLKKEEMGEESKEVQRVREGLEKRLGGTPHPLLDALGALSSEDPLDAPQGTASEDPDEGTPDSPSPEKSPKKKKPLKLHGLLLLAAQDDQGNFGVPCLAEAAGFSPEVHRGYAELLKALKNFSSEASPEKPVLNPEERVLEALNKVYDALVTLLSGKEKLLRRHVLGRRLGASGRGVIVPDPTLPLHEVRLPGRMVGELLQGHGLEGRYGLNDEVREKLHGADEDQRREALAELEDCLERKPLWVLLIRQPTLHRQNVQAFRVRVWDERALALPPFITAGFNADFDGDTMAVFLPPEPWCEDLSSLSPLENPGRIGEGDLAYQTKLDLALGWKALDAEARNRWAQKASLSGGKGSLENVALEDVVKGLLRRGEELLALQKEVCAGSTGACSLPPGEFFRCAQDLREKREEFLCRAEKAQNKDELKKLEKEADNAVGAWLTEERKETSLNRLIGSKARGKAGDLRQICLFLGYQNDFVESEFPEPPPSTSVLVERAKKSVLKSADPADPWREGWIAGAFWSGLEDRDLFRYAYASRSAMTSKKLAVAEAGYLARLLAEGLYDVTVEKEDCGASWEQGMKLVWDPEQKRIRIASVAGEEVGTFLPGESPEKVLGNVAWGRIPVGMDRPLEEEDLAAVRGFWQDENSEPLKPDLREILQKTGGALVLRSPLGCLAQPGLCARCWGVDPARRWLQESPPPLPQEESAVGLVSAMALGERGTQLSMRRFHQVGAGGQVSIPALRALLVEGKGLPSDGEEPSSDGKKRPSAPARLKILLEKVLTSGSSRCDELPQALVHFETALRFSADPGGLRGRAQSREGRWLAAATFESLRDVLMGPENDEARGLKSRVLLGEPGEDEAPSSTGDHGDPGRAWEAWGEEKSSCPEQG